MPFTGLVKNLRRGDSSLKLIYVIAATDESEDECEELIIPNLVRVCFKWKSTIFKDKGLCKLQSYFTLEKDTSCVSTIIKTNISSNELKYSNTGIHTPEDRNGHWELMGYIFMSPTMAKGNKTGMNWIAAIDFLITAYEVKMDTISSKLYNDTDLTDFFLCATGGKVAVHKAYLGAHSDVFKAMLKGEWKETVEGQIKLDGVTVETLEHLKDYMYLGTVPDDGLRPLLLVARCYLIEDLEKHCIRKLAETVLPEDLFSLLEFACVNNITELAIEMLQITQNSVVNKALQLKREAVLEKQSDVKSPK